MKMWTITTAVLCLGAAAAPARAQDETPLRGRGEVAVRVPFEKATRGAPYSADTLIEGAQALADGNRISYRSTGRVYRDGEGRTRREEDRGDGTVGISLVDPVGGFSYSLDPVNKIAWRTTMGAAGAIMGKIEAAQTQERKTIQEKEAAEQKMAAVSQDARQKLAAVEQEQVRAAAGGEGAVMRGRGYAMAPTTPLEHKTIDGIQVEGRKTTTTIPAGKIGNELPLTIVSEEWRSPDLNVLVLTHHSDPRSGDSSYRLTNIIRAEPDPSLFVVPSDYTVKDTGIKRMLEAARQPGR